MALTRIKSQSILDREVRERDLADGAVTINKINLLTNGSAGDVLTVDSFGNLLFAPVGGTPISLDSLTDVNTTGAVNNDILQYNSATLKWEAGTLVFDSIDSFDDVDTSTTPPVGGQVLAWNGVSLRWEPLTVSGVGASSNTYVVDNIAARDALTAAEGDSCFVRSGVSGEYEMYVWDAAWILLATQDSARTDANTIDTGLPSHPHGNILFNDTTPVIIGNISDGSRVTSVTIEIITPFDGDIATLPSTTPPAFFSIGDDGQNDRLFIDDSTNGTVDWLTTGTYTCTVDYTYDGSETAGATDTAVKAYFNFSGPATTGEARVIVTHV